MYSAKKYSLPSSTEVQAFAIGIGYSYDKCVEKGLPTKFIKIATSEFLGWLSQKGNNIIDVNRKECTLGKWHLQGTKKWGCTTGWGRAKNFWDFSPSKNTCKLWFSYRGIKSGGTSAQLAPIILTPLGNKYKIYGRTNPRILLGFPP